MLGKQLVYFPIYTLMTWEPPTEWFLGALSENYVSELDSQIVHDSCLLTYDIIQHSIYKDKRSLFKIDSTICFKSLKIILIDILFYINSCLNSCCVHYLTNKNKMNTNNSHF